LYAGNIILRHLVPSWSYNSSEGRNLHPVPENHGFERNLQVCERIVQGARVSASRHLARC
jgi:hypothetical protein